MGSHHTSITSGPKRLLREWVPYKICEMSSDSEGHGENNDSLDFNGYVYIDGSLPPINESQGSVWPGTPSRV